MPGNPHYEVLAGEKMLPEHGIIHAILAVAFELRSQTLVAYAASTPATLAEGIDVDIRERLGMP